MKIIWISLLISLLACPVWADENSKGQENPPSTLFMSLQEVQKMQAREKEKAAAMASSRPTGLPKAPPPLPERKAGFAEKLVSGIVKGAARQEQLNNPDRDLRPRADPINPHWRGTEEN